jgi:hypothetical protein
MIFTSSNKTSVSDINNALKVICTLDITALIYKNNQPAIVE